MAITDTGNTKPVKAAEFKAIFARNLNDLCDKSPLTQKELANQIGISERQFRRWRTPTVADMPKHYMIPIMAVLFKVPIDELYSAKGVGFARNKREIKLLKMIRLGKPNLPIELIYEALTMLLGSMSNGDRIAWIEMGYRLANYYSQASKSKHERQDKEA